METIDQFIIEYPSGEIVWVTRTEMRVLSSYSLIHYESGKNFWYFPYQRREDIERILRYERIMVT